MASAPRFKVYDSHGTYQAAVKEPEAGACLASMYGPGSTVRDGHLARDVVWTEGEDGIGVESYDRAARVMADRARLGWTA